MISKWSVSYGNVVETIRIGVGRLARLTDISYNMICCLNLNNIKLASKVEVLKDHMLGT